MTVTGSIEPSDLGFSQCHEHLLISRGRSFEINHALCIDKIENSIKDVLDFKEAGGKTIIDAQPCGCNRMETGLALISSKTGVNIISSTGFHKMCFYPENHWIHTASEDELTAIFTSELKYGMYVDADTTFPSCQCSARAGIIKTAFDKEELSNRYKRLFRAAVESAIDTNCAISVHIEQDTNPLYLLDYLLKIGMNPQKLIFCHMDRACRDLSLHQQVLKEGVSLEYDTIGRFKYHDDNHEISIFQTMLAQGFENQLLFSLDTTRERLKSYTPSGIGLDYLMKIFIPHMIAAGISPHQINLISCENIRRILST